MLSLIFTIAGIIGVVYAIVLAILLLWKVTALVMAIWASFCERD